MKTKPLCIILSGPPGSGKTRCISTLAQHLALQGRRTFAVYQPDTGRDERGLAITFDIEFLQAGPEGSVVERHPLAYRVKYAAEADLDAARSTAALQTDRPAESSPLIYGAYRFEGAWFRKAEAFLTKVLPSLRPGDVCCLDEIGQLEFYMQQGLSYCLSRAFSAIKEADSSCVLVCAVKAECLGNFMKLLDEQGFASRLVQPPDPDRVLRILSHAGSPVHESAYSQLQSLLAKGQRTVIATLLGDSDKAPTRCCLSGLQIESPGAAPGEVSAAAAAPEGSGSAPVEADEADPVCATILGQPELLQAAHKALATGAMTWASDEDGRYVLFSPSYPSPRLIILGAGHIAIPLAEFGSRLGFSVTVCDDRPSFANKARFPTAARVICDYWPGIFAKLALDPASYVVIVTRGHRYDMDCFRAVAGLDLPYVGMIGSARRIIGVKNQLESEGIPRHRLDRLHAPIGLKIGAITPEEIALAIAAEVVAARRTEVKDTSSDTTDAALMTAIATPSDERRALVTVVSTHGSVPRGPGARMLVAPRGEIVGSIGGGCCESEAILAAIDIARSGGYVLRKVDLSGSVAEDEGMACGGSMEILIEEL